MSTPEYRSGEYVVVRYGRDARQLAKLARPLAGGWRAWKFRAQSRRWTQLLTIFNQEIEGYAADLAPELLRRARVTPAGLAK